MKITTIRKKFDNFFDESTKFAYSAIDAIEHVQTRLAFWIFHFTTVLSMVRFWCLIGEVWVGTKNPLLTGVFQIVGSMLNLIGSRFLREEEPYHQLLFSSYCILWIFGGYNVYTNLPEIGIILRLFIQLGLSCGSIVSLWYWKKYLIIDEKEDTHKDLKVEEDTLKDLIIDEIEDTQKDIQK